jgi:hypothetical protein
MHEYLGVGFEIAMEEVVRQPPFVPTRDRGAVHFSLFSVVQALPFLCSYPIVYLSF